MAKQNINIGNQANDRSGDPLRTAFDKINQNFTELYTRTNDDIQIPSQTGNANKYLKTDGTALSWATVAGGGGGVSISDFGEGFTDSLDAGKITTSKLYNENPNQGLNNQYTLEVTDGGVVVLPDQSIINGATLKTVAGNYAGITAGPASPAGKDEDSWMWVDNNGATIATKYSTDAHTWTFNNSGALTFPQGTTIATADGTDAFIIDGAVDKDIQIYTYSGPTPTAHGWTFGTDGSITFPDNTVQTTAYTGQSGGSGNISKRYVAVNVNGTVYGSADGENWTPYTSTMDNINQVAVGPTNIVYTADRSVGNGQSLWYASAYNSAPTEVAPAENVEEDYSEVKYFSSIGKYVAVGHVVEGNNFPVLLHSSDGITWTRSYVSEGFIAELGFTGNAAFVDIAENDLGFFIISDSSTLGGFFLENITDALDATTNVEQAESDWVYVVWVETAAEGLRGWHVFDDDQDWRFNANEDPRVGSFPYFEVDDLDPVFEAAVGYSDDPSEIVVGDYDGVSTIVIGTGDGQIMYWPAQEVQPTVVIPKPYTSSISDIIRGTTTTIEWTGTRNRKANGQKIVITGATTQQGEPGTTNQSYNGTYYIKRIGEGTPYTHELYTDQALTTPWDTTTYWPVNTNTGTLTWSHGQYIDALHYSNGIFYAGNDDEEFFISTDGGATWTETDSLTVDEGEAGGFINDIDSYGTTTTNKLINGTQEFTLNANGSVTFPDGSIQTTAYTGTTGDQNVWVQTFESVEGAPDDVVAAAMSVEYDVEGNLVCVFSHALDYSSPFGGTGSYFSVAKISTTGIILWQKRLGAGTYTDGWGLAVDSNDGSVYIAGSNLPDNESQDFEAMLTKIDLANGGFQWSKIYQVTGSNGQSPVVDVASDGNPVMVSYFENGNDNYIATTKVDSTDGSVIWSRKFDGQGSDYAYGMGVGANGDVVTVGYVDRITSLVESYPVTTQTGSGLEVLVINRSDLTGSGTFTTNWKVAGSGISEYADVTFINSYSALTSTVQQGTGATFNITIAGDGSITNPVTVANGGSNYLVGHKIKIPYTAIGGADLNSDIILTVTGVDSGSINAVAAGFYGGGAGTPNTYNGVTGTNYQTGSGLVFTLSLDSGSTYTEHNYTFQSVGANYVTGDVVVIPGTQLGGTSPANDLTATVSVTENGAVTTFNSFSGAQQTTTYRIIVAESEVDFGADGTWTLNEVDVDYSDRMLVIKYNSAGAIQWQKAIQFDDGFNCNGADCDIDSAGNIYVTGQYNKTDENGVALSIVKLNSSGVKQWSRRVTGNCDTFGTSIVVGADNCLYLSGITGIENPDENGVPYADTHSVLAKYSTAGTVLWQRLLENSSTWSFTGAFFQAGASNLAVKDDYVALSGGYGDFDSTTFSASVAQVSADGTAFSVDEWDFVASNFSGTFFDDASDITVIDADKTDSDFIGNIIVTEGASMDPTGIDFLIGTVYREVVGADDRLVNSSNQLILESTGTVTLPKGGTISEGIVTSNPTIQLTPASPDVASQKLVIKGGGPPASRTDNGITVDLSEIDVTVGDTITVNVYSDVYAEETLYWWIYPQDAGISIDSEFGTVAIDGDGDGVFTILVDSDDYEFTVRVSPINGQYDPDNVGVESVLINASAPTYPDYHLHLTTGNLTETSIFLGTDDHNVRTTTVGNIEITTPGIATVDGIVLQGTGYTNGTYTNQATTGGSGTGLTVDYLVNTNQVVTVTINQQGLGYNNGDVITIPGGSSNATVLLDVAANNVWEFGTDGALTVPDAGIVGGPVGTNKIDLSWDLSILAGRTIKINPGASGVVSPTYWSFSSDVSGGGILFPAGSVIDDRVSGVLIGGAGQTAVNRFYTKVSNTLYQTVDEGVTYQLVNEAGTWSLAVLGQDNPRYTSTDLITWTAVVGAAPAPTGELSIRATELSVGTGNTWAFGGDGSLTLPDGAPILFGGNNCRIQALQAFSISSDGGIAVEVTDKQWLFNPDGSTTFPNNTLQSRDGLTLTTGGEFNICTIQTAGSGYQNGNSTSYVTGGTGTDMVVGYGFGLSGQIVSVGVVAPGTGYTDGDVLTMTAGDGTATFVITRYNALANQANNNTIEFDWTFSTSGTLTLPGAVVKSTVAKTGAVNPGIDKVATVSIEPTFDAAWGNATNVSVGGFSCDIVFQQAGYAIFVNIVDTVGNRTVGDTLATVLGSTLGGGADMVIKVATLTDTIATAIDLTKTVNKLANGAYTLANGVEGQIMYLVGQTGAISTEIGVVVANYRVNGSENTGGLLLPFRVYDYSDESSYDSFSNICTLIFTDGAWQQSGGVWE